MALLLALDVEPHVWLQVSIVFLSSAALLREERVLDHNRIHAENRLVGQAVILDRLCRLRDVAFADV